MLKREYIKYGSVCLDCPRYAALGNSMVVPVMAWIGERINNYLMECAQ